MTSRCIDGSDSSECPWNAVVELKDTQTTNDVRCINRPTPFLDKTLSLSLQNPTCWGGPVSSHLDLITNLAVCETNSLHELNLGKISSNYMSKAKKPNRIDLSNVTVGNNSGNASWRTHAITDSHDLEIKRPNNTGSSFNSVLNLPNLTIDAENRSEVVNSNFAHENPNNIRPCIYQSAEPTKDSKSCKYYSNLNLDCFSSSYEFDATNDNNPKDDCIMPRTRPGFFRKYPETGEDSYDESYISSCSKLKCNNENIKYTFKKPKELNQSIIKYHKPDTNPNSDCHQRRDEAQALLIALIENFCNLYDRTDPKKNSLLFGAICRRLLKMRVLSPSDFYRQSDERLRGVYLKAFQNLINDAIHSLDNDIVEDLSQFDGFHEINSHISAPLDWGGNQNLLHSPFTAHTLNYESFRQIYKMCPANNSMTTGIYDMNNEHVSRFPQARNISMRSRFLEEFCDLEAIGRGGFARVFQGKNILDGRRYAFKRIYFEETRGPKYEKILREIKALAGLEHPNIVRYHGAWVESANASHPLIGGQSLTFDSLNESFNQFTDGDSQFSNHDESLSSCDCSDFTIKLQHNSAQNHSEKDEAATQIQNYKLRNSGYYMFIQMELCQLTLEDWLEQRNHLIANCQFDNITENDDSKITLSPSQLALEHVHEINGILNPLSVDNYEALQSTIVKKNVQFILNRSECWRIFRCIIKAILLIHRTGIIHRDLKPGNILFQAGQSLIPKVGDFGLASSHQFDSSFADKYINVNHFSEKLSLKETIRSGDSATKNGFGKVSNESSKDSSIKSKSDHFISANQKSNNNEDQKIIKLIEDLQLGNSSKIEIDAPIEDDLSDSAKQVSVFNDSNCVFSSSSGTYAPHTTGLGTQMYAAPEQINALPCGNDICNCKLSMKNLHSTGHDQSSKSICIIGGDEKCYCFYDEKVDIYSLGIILFELLYPFRTKMERQEVLVRLTTKGQFPEEFASHWPQEATFISSCLSADPEMRPSAAEIINSSIFIACEEKENENCLLNRAKATESSNLDETIKRLSRENGQLRQMVLDLL